MDPIPMTLDFVLPCDDRVLDKDNYLCQTLGSEIGHPVAVGPKMCAECMLRGSPDRTILDRYVIRARLGQLDMARLGFYKNEDDILTLLTTIWPLVKDRPSERARVATLLTQLVDLKRVSLASAEKLVQETMKELMTDGDPGQASTGSRATPANITGIGKKPDPGVSHSPSK